jgi:hypothetical protein
MVATVSQLRDQVLHTGEQVSVEQAGLADAHSGTVTWSTLVAQAMDGEYVGHDGGVHLRPAEALKELSLIQQTALHAEKKPAAKGLQGISEVPYGRLKLYYRALKDGLAVDEFADIKLSTLQVMAAGLFVDDPQMVDQVVDGWETKPDANGLNPNEAHWSPTVHHRPGAPFSANRVKAFLIELILSKAAPGEAFESHEERVAKEQLGKEVSGFHQMAAWHAEDAFGSLMRQQMIASAEVVRQAERDTEQRHKGLLERIQEAVNVRDKALALSNLTDSNLTDEGDGDGDEVSRTALTDLEMDKLQALAIDLEVEAADVYRAPDAATLVRMIANSTGTPPTQLLGEFTAVDFVRKKKLGGNGQTETSPVEGLLQTYTRTPAATDERLPSSIRPQPESSAAALAAAGEQVTATDSPAEGGAELEPNPEPEPEPELEGAGEPEPAPEEAEEPQEPEPQPKPEPEPEPEGKPARSGHHDVRVLTPTALSHVLQWNTHAILAQGFRNGIHVHLFAYNIAFDAVDTADGRADERGHFLHADAGGIFSGEETKTTAHAGEMHGQGGGAVEHMPDWQMFEVDSADWEDLPDPTQVEVDGLIREWMDAGKKTSCSVPQWTDVDIKNLVSGKWLRVKSDGVWQQLFCGLREQGLESDKGAWAGFAKDMKVDEVDVQSCWRVEWEIPAETYRGERQQLSNHKAVALAKLTRERGSGAWSRKYLLTTTLGGQELTWTDERAKALNWQMRWSSECALDGAAVHVQGTVYASTIDGAGCDVYDIDLTCNGPATSDVCVKSRPGDTIRVCAMPSHNISRSVIEEQARIPLLQRWCRMAGINPEKDVDIENHREAIDRIADKLEDELRESQVDVADVHGADAMSMVAKKLGLKQSCNSNEGPRAIMRAELHDAERQWWSRQLTSNPSGSPARLQVTIIKASALQAKASADVFCRLLVDGESADTDVVTNGGDSPKWLTSEANAPAFLLDTGDVPTCKLQIYDKNAATNELLGEAVLTLHENEGGKYPHAEKWAHSAIVVELSNAAGPAGQLTISLQWEVRACCSCLLVFVLWLTEH